MVAWTAFPAAGLKVLSGAPASYRGASGSLRQFCPICGAAVFFFNEEMLPGIVDVPTIGLDDPERFAPQAHIQFADRRGWMDGVDKLPKFERFPGG